MMPDDERSGDLLDVALADEIELVSDLVVAASSSPRHFTPEEVDALLGISGEPTFTARPLHGSGPARADSGE
jgi:hypothetical protein